MYAVLKQSLQLIDQLTEFPVPPMVVLTGGDPFQRAGIVDLIGYAARRHLNVTITLRATPLVTSTGSLHRTPARDGGCVDLTRTL